MKRLILCLFLFSVGYSSNALALWTCLDDESVQKTAEHWGYYDPEVAVAFGKQIRKVVRQKDLQGLAALIGPGELDRGPRKRRFEEEEWSDIFGDKFWWGVTFSFVECKPVGWRGFMLGSGLVWYGCGKTSCSIFAINDWIERPANVLDNVLWEINDTTVHPHCFYLEMASGDNYEVLLDGINCAAEKIGECLEREDGISLYKQAFGETLAVNIASCPVRWDGTENEASREIDPESGFTVHRDGRGFTSYRVVRVLPTELCQRLAPHIPYTCRDIRLVELHDNNGGTATWSAGNIYGLFSDTDKGHEIMVPLLNFRTLNEALNYIDGLLEKQE